MTDSHEDVSDLLPLREPTFLILLSLAEGQKHGYAIIKDVAEMSRDRVTLSTGTLYEALARLLDQLLIERVEEPDEMGSHPGRPRKAYRLTLRGQRAVQAEVNRLQNLIAAAQQRLGLERQGSGD
ncbi:MAG: PadR family transcriptional regulator [Anaerolineae bacterium]|nr:PadR family transcriptional regulator [Anaerolineae bacterium]